MYPMYGWTDSYPRPMNQMVYPPFHSQSFEAVPPHMKMDPARPVMFEPWPYGGSYGYSYPTECHGCCNHKNYYPGHYGFRPPFHHFPPPSPHSYHGSYPAFFGGYSGYQIPPPHYSMEKPRYEYDKSFLMDQHCCGCSNHSCKREPEKNVKNEEWETDIDKKSSASLVPSNLRDLPFPFMMIPPGYLMDSEGKKITKPEEEEDNKIHHDAKCDKSSKSLKQEKETPSQLDMQSQFPFPLFWLPYKSDEFEKEDHKRMSSGQKDVITPFQEMNDKVKNPSSATGPKMIGNGETQMTAPVKKMEQVEEKKKDEERKVKAIPVMQVNENQDKGCAGNNVKKPAASPKSSKLPPVCLRVDPVSKSRKVNGSSRSPSPPADKGRSRQSSSENSGSSTQKEQSQNQADKNKEVESRKKTVNMVEGTTTERKKEAQTNNHVRPSREEVSSRKSGVEEVNVVVNQDVGEATEGKKLDGQSVNKEEAKKVRKNMLSDVEAATIIQSVSRGYEVRKSEPLKKLRQIAEVSQKMSEVKARISALDSCSDVEIDEKQLVAIGETIMSLLLKLDTIQGLHPCVRDIRKSVAKELVSLQEKLDTLTTRKAQAPIVPPSLETADGPTEIGTDNVSVDNNPNEAEVVLDSTQVGGICTDAQPVENGLSGNNISELSLVKSVDRETELEGQKSQDLDNGDGQIITENEESLELERAVETPVFHADDEVDTQIEGSDSSSLVDPSGKVGEVAEQPIDSPITEITGNVGPGEDPIVEDLENDAAIENTTLDTAQESHLGSEERDDGKVQVKDVSDTEKHEEEEVVSEMEGSKFSPEEDHEVQTETELTTTSVQENEATDTTTADDLKEASIELSTPVQEKEATDITDDLKETRVTLERVPPVVEDRVRDGGDENAPLSPEDQPKNELPMQNVTVDHMIDQMTVGPENQGKVEMENGGEMVNKGDGKDREVMEENMRLKEMMEKLIEAGNEQLATITKLSGKVKDLEKKLTKKRKLKTKKPRGKRQDVLLV